MKIEQIIHQVWEGRTEAKMPVRLKLLSETWKEKNPTWEYHLWNGDEMDELVSEYFKDYLPMYKQFPFNVQRWDTIRYMILYIKGGVYTDLDTECYKPIDPLFQEKELCFGEEPPKHNFHKNDGINVMVGNAFMASNKYNKAWLFLLEQIEKSITIEHKKKSIILETTGPLLISRNINALKKEFNADILPYDLVTPVEKIDVVNYALGKNNNQFKEKIKKAYCGHYFFGSWEKSISIYK